MAYQGKNSGIQLLRIFAMLIIIGFHFTDHGAVKVTDNLPTDLNFLFLAFFHLGGGIGNCLFVLITGYLLCDKTFKIRRLILLYSEILFYSVISYYIAVKRGHVEPNLLVAWFPITNIRYWFMSTYFLLVALFPFINMIISECTKKQHALLILLLFLVCSVFYTFKSAYFATPGSIECFIMLYLIGAFINKYRIDIPRRTNLILITFMALSMVASVVYFNVTKLRPDIGFYVWDMKKTPVVVISVLIFILFIKLRTKYENYVDYIASSVFAVYLIHIGDLWQYIFLKMFNDQIIYQSMFFPIWLIASVFVIFSLCIIIDKVRYYLLAVPVLYILRKVFKVSWI
ncbi:MAG: acyltransferase family protein [Succinivibrio sp.]|nr:acyltransferase family protein [Succinivibrio sp.]